MDKNIKHIFVDLDGTLIKTDILFESAVKFLVCNPLNAFLLLVWLMRGRSFLKHKLAERVELDISSLPFNDQFLDYLREKKKQGFSLILATAAHRRYAQEIEDHLGVFDGIIATDEKNNMKGRRKLEAIKEYVGDQPFGYAGDNNADVPIWAAADLNIFVNAPSSAIETATKEKKETKIFETRSRTVLGALRKEMRLHQWAKNVLIFVPLLTSHEYSNLNMIFAVLIAFICFSLCASGAYFLNDLLDLDADRNHEFKNKRPLASGDLSLPLGVAGALVLPTISLLLAVAFLPSIYVLVLAIYYLITNLYSLYLKRISTADVMTLAVLYTMRIIAGAAATGIALTSWLIAFSIFVFVSLAFLKRYIEISRLEKADSKARGRGYTGDDSETMFVLGSSNLTVSVLVLALYVNSDAVSALYKTPEILWLLCFLMLYWGSRIWVGARRGKIYDDPVVFAIMDKVSRITGLGFIVIILAAKFIEI